MTLTTMLGRLLVGEAAGPWGDGFADDDWGDLAAVRCWDDLEPDQYVRLYPRLAAVERTVPACLLAHLKGCVAARAWRLRHVHGLAGDPRLTTLAYGSDASGAQHHATLFRPLRTFVSRLRPRQGPADSSDIVSEELAALVFLGSILAGAQRVAGAEIGGDQTAWFAYLTGIHPAYLWPAAALTYERDTAAGWLGVVARGRPAFMPLEVADYFADVVTRKGGRLVIVDSQIASLALSGVDVEHLWAAAARCRRGEAVVVRGAGMARVPSTAVRPSTTSAWDPADPLRAETL